MNNEYSKELYHYGVLGMRWGVRRFQPYPSDYKGKGVEIGDAKREKRRISEDDDIVIKKGTKMYRITKDPNDKTSSKYLTVDPADRAYYKVDWPAGLRKTGAVNEGDTIYENVYKSKEDLRSPSMLKRQAIAAGLLKDDSIKSEVTKNSTTRGFLDINPGLNWKKAKSYIEVASLPEKEYKEFYKTLDDSGKKLFDSIRKEYKNDLKYFKDRTLEMANDEQWLARIVLSNMGGIDKIKVEYGKKIIEAGYNMSIDDHGADFSKDYAQVNAPIIVYMSNDLLKQVGSKKVTDLDIKRSREKAIDVAKADRNNLYKYHVPNVLKTAYGLDRYY